MDIGPVTYFDLLVRCAKTVRMLAADARTRMDQALPSGVSREDWTLRIQEIATRLDTLAENILEGRADRLQVEEQTRSMLDLGARLSDSLVGAMAAAFVALERYQPDHPPVLSRKSAPQRRAR